ncbi:MAG: hypothetical protein R3C05_22075 [Pirellulaceae bacterium]
MIEFDDSTDGEVWRQFESAWKRGKRPCLWDAVSEVNPAIRTDLAAEFAMIELEWRWRLDISDEPRTAAHFIQLLSPLSLQPEHFVSMLEHEFIVRSQWGDAPTIDQMLDGLPAQNQLRDILQVGLNENFPIHCRLRSDESNELDENEDDNEQVFPLNIHTQFKQSVKIESAETDAELQRHGLTTTCVLFSTTPEAKNVVFLELQRLSINRLNLYARSQEPICLLDGRLLNVDVETPASLTSQLRIGDHFLKFHRHF